MTSQPAYPGYATPTFTRSGAGDCWIVVAHPWTKNVGRVYDYGAVGWTALDDRARDVGLFPDKQAAGEALIRHAGYEVLA